MVPYRGKHPIKQFILNKHMRFRYKIWFICGTDGYPYNFQMYKGKEIGPKWEALGPRVVEDMAMPMNISFILTTLSQAINYVKTLISQT